MAGVHQLLLHTTDSATPAVYIEDVFSTRLYDGTGSAQTIANGIDLATRGGLVWIKGRSTTSDHALYDTARGATLDLLSNLTTAQTTQEQGLTAFLGSGFSIGTLAKLNTSPEIYAAWTFAEQQKFFDIVTYTGNGANRTIAHNLGSVPGCIIVKRLSGAAAWQVYHRSNLPLEYLELNTTNGAQESTQRWNDTEPTASVFSLGIDATVNTTGSQYVAYLFAHNAGGFGAAGTDNVISCGSYNGNGSAAGPTVTLGWEPQWLLIKRAAGAGANWVVFDNLRGMTVGGTTDSYLVPNTTGVESIGEFLSPLATGFQLTTTSTLVNATGSKYVYIAIRRGPMRTPTLGTDVFMPTVYTGTNVNNRLVNTSIAPDTVWMRQRNDTVLAGMVVGDRLRGQPYLLAGSNTAEVTNLNALSQQNVSGEYGTAFTSMNGVWVGTDATAKLNVNTTANNHIAEAFRRAPGFFDVVCYTGTGSSMDVPHNLGVVPELILVRRRTVGGEWNVYSAPTGSGSIGFINTTAAFTSSGAWRNLTPTSSLFYLNTGANVVNSGGIFVAYLFASCPGVSKVGSYTGTGSTVQVDCGFTAGARFVLIKRTNGTGDWYVWDSARGVISANDPYLVLNTTAAEVTSTDWVDTIATGFEVSNAASNLVNANGANYLFLAIA